MSIQSPETVPTFFESAWSLLKQLDWLLALIAGAMIGRFVSRWGRVRMFVVNWKLWTVIVDSKGNRSVGESIRCAEEADFSYHFQFTNNKPHTFSLREGAILFKKGKLVRHRRPIFSTLNIGPGETESVQDFRCIDSNLIDELRECDIVDFEATKPNGKKLTKRIARFPSDD